MTATPTSLSPPAPSIPNSITSSPRAFRAEPRAYFSAIRATALSPNWEKKPDPALPLAHSSRGVAFGDFDNDGDMDILIMNRNEPPSLLRNDAPNDNRWIKIRLEGTKSNRSAIGARVLAHYSGKVQAQAVTSQSSYLSVNDPRLHFGLGSATAADFDIYWPSGAKESYPGLAADQLHTIKEGKGIVPSRPFSK